MSEELKEARELIKKGWTKHFYAINANGLGVEVDSDAAVAFCLSGAMCRANVSMEDQKKVHTIVRKMEVPCAPCGFDSIEEFNDDFGTSQEMVVDTLDLAIRTGKWRIFFLRMAGPFYRVIPDKST